MAEGHDGHLCDPLGGEGGVIADALAGRHGAQLQDRRLQGGDRLDPPVMPLLRSTAVEGDPGPDQVEMEVRAEEDPGGVGEALAGLREQGCGLGEGLQLASVHRMIRGRPAGQVAHHQVDLETPQPVRPLGEGRGLLDAKAEAVEAGVDVQGDPLAALSAGKF